MKQNDEFKLKTYIVTSAVYVFMLCYEIVAWAVVLNLFWSWFLSPIFNLEPINYYEAVGGMMVSTIFIREPFNYVLFLFKNPKKKTYNEVTKTFLTFMSPWLTLLAGLAVHLAMYDILF